MFFSRNINLTNRRLNFRTALTFFKYLLLIKISIGVNILFGIDSVIDLLMVLIYKKRSVLLPLNSNRYKESNLQCFVIFHSFAGHHGPPALLGFTLLNFEE